MIRKLLKSDYNNYLKLINKFRNTNFTQTQFEEVLTNLENTNNFIFSFHWLYFTCKCSLHLILQIKLL